MAALAFSEFAWSADSDGKCNLAMAAGEAQRTDRPGYHDFLEIYQPPTPPDASGYPVIFWYHGYSDSLRPNTTIMRAVTGGEVFVVVGMDYASEAFYEDLEHNELDKEILNFYSTLQAIETCVPVNRDKLVLGGYSQGGYATTLIGERIVDDLAGMIVLGAGRSEGAKNLPNENQMEGIPIFMAAGMRDFVHGENVEATARVYALLGAEVSMERWPETDHVEGWSWYQNDESRTVGLRTWLNRLLDE